MVADLVKSASASLGMGADGMAAEIDSTVCGTLAESVDCDITAVTAMAVDIDVMAEGPAWVAMVLTECYWGELCVTMLLVVR